MIVNVVLASADEFDQLRQGRTAIENGHLRAPVVIRQRSVATADQRASVHLGFHPLRHIPRKISAVDQAVLAAMLVLKTQNIAIEMIRMPDRRAVAVIDDAGDAGPVVLPRQLKRCAGKGVACWIHDRQIARRAAGCRLFSGDGDIHFKPPVLV